MIIIDKIESGIAVCEHTLNGALLPISLSEIEGTPKEGDLLVLRNGKYLVDVLATARRREEMQQKLRSLFRPASSGEEE